MPLPIRSRLRLSAAILLASASLVGCSAPGPMSPTVMALPAKGENFEVFQQHEATCRQFASTQTGGESAGQHADKSAVASAVVGTGIGAAAGALFGSVTGHAGNGAAIGAGTGLLAGSLAGASRGRRAAASLQEQYNISYTQCMTANGEDVQAPIRRAVYIPPPPRIVYAPIAVYGPPPPPPPGVVVQPEGP
jgi:hypothetical protein